MSVMQTLGLDDGAVVAVVHADDIGMSHAANVGAFEAHDRGPVTCGSVMMPCSWATEVLEWAGDGRDVDLGIHLTLNAEYDGYRWGPLAGRGAVPILVDGAGQMPRTSEEVYQSADPSDVETELRMQIDVALDQGLDVTHLDAHMGTAFHPKFIEIVLRLGREYALPMFLPRVMLTTYQDRGHLPADTIDSLEAEGHAVFDGFDADSLGFTPGDGEEHNLGRIAALEPGLNYLICHPAAAGDELSAITDTDHQRDFERQFYGGEAGRSALAERGVTTIGMRELRDILRA
jgi:predicted glycoside hydrolase/deacetylase ChbG (UPF0249 family)